MSSSVYFNGRHGRGHSRGVKRTVWPDRVAVVFTGFHTADEAYRMAISSYDALRRWLRTQRRTGPLRGAAQVLHRRRDARHCHLALHGVSIGGIVEPGDPRIGCLDGYGFELLLPHGLGQHGADRALRVVASAIARHSGLHTLKPAGAARKSCVAAPWSAQGDSRSGETITRRA